MNDDFRDQFSHADAASYAKFIDTTDQLGISALRYSVSWERLTQNPEGWVQVSEDLNRLSDQGVRPIVGLIHHGSGPATTNLLDPGFAAGLAAHARETVQRFPWVREWIPVNEPLTTARFSALYGLWYPHVADEWSFWLALLNQIDATRLSMRQIRRVNPDALLVQTEDLGRTYATAALGNQCGFDNTRRWMTWDLLSGRVDTTHPFWRRLVGMGFADRLRAIADDPCPPDIIGVNHYLTSDRFLDHRTQRYPPEACGGNGNERYADVAAIRVLHPAPTGFEGALREAWQRYGTPLAITECHNACTREEQMRWTAEAWATARSLREEGVGILAVTAWAVAGSRNWASLLTRDDDHYECGAFDTRGGNLRPTAMVPLLKQLADGTDPKHPVVTGTGWWQRDIRMEYQPAPMPTPVAALTGSRQTDKGSPLLIAGGTGTLGRAIAAACRHRGLSFILTTRSDMDLTDERSIDAALERYKPWAVVNATGWVRVDDAQSNADQCLAINVRGAIRLARACDSRGIHYSGISTDLVFDGTKGALYDEDDRPSPLNVYGQSKAEAEDAIQNGLTVRTAAFFSPHDEHNFAVAVRNALAAGEKFVAANDYFVTPTYVPDLVEHLLDLVIDGERGIWHLSNGEELSWAQFAHHVADACGLPTDLIAAVPGETLGWAAPRPPRSGLGTNRGVRMPSLAKAIDRFAGG